MRILSLIFLALSACAACADELPRNLRNLPPCKQGKKSIPAHLITHNGAHYALVDIIPDRGATEVTR